MDRAIFLDRDGVINANVFNVDTGEWESPNDAEHFVLFPWVTGALRRLQDHGFLLFLVSNQPNYAKGKTSLENLQAIQHKLYGVLTGHGIGFTEYYYCFHHPQGVVPEVSFPCACRKPGVFFLEEAAKKYCLDMRLSWMVGDRDTDIICGKNAGTRTVMVMNKEELSAGRAGESHPDFSAADLLEATELICSHS